MNAPAITVVPDFVAVTGEAPLWCQRTSTLYWLDLQGRTLQCLPAPFTHTRSLPLPYRPSCLCLRPDGTLLVGYRKGLGIIDPATGATRQLPLGPVDLDVVSFNDGIADAAGRLWIGTRHREATDPVGALYRIGPGLHVHRAQDGITLSNGLAFSPGGRTLYHADSRPGLVHAYDVDMAAGTLSARRLLLDYTGAGRRPDGMTVDAEGALWVAEIDGWRIARYAPDGTRLQEIMLPVQKPSSLAFGGDDMRTLFVTSIAFGLTDAELARQPAAGRLLMLRPGPMGVAEHACTIADGHGED